MPKRTDILIMLVSCALLLGGCEFNPENLLLCETRFSEIEDTDRPFEDDIFVYDTIFTYEHSGVDRSVIDNLIAENEGASFTVRGGEHLVSITKPKLARENAVETGCAEERDGMRLTSITFAATSERPTN